MFKLFTHTTLGPGMTGVWVDALWVKRRRGNRVVEGSAAPTKALQPLSVSQMLLHIYFMRKLPLTGAHTHTRVYVQNTQAGTQRKQAAML